MEHPHDIKMENLLDLSVICRTCLCVTPSTISVTSKDLKYNIPLSDMINRISAFERQENDQLPDKLCFSCAEQIRIAYGFQQTCDESYRILLNHLSQLKLPYETKEADVGDCQETKDLEQHVPQYNQESNVNNLKNEVEYLEEPMAEDEKSAGTTNGHISKEDSSDTDEELEPTTVPGEDGIMEIENQCSICGQILSKLDHLKRHMKVHEGVKPFKCKHCDKAFSRADNLRMHEKTHSLERNHKCPQCDQSFKRVDMVKQHMGSQHREYVNEHYHVCTVCDNFFQTQEKLTAHMQVHNSDNQLVCEVCGKVFVRLLAYEAHMQRHSSASKEPETFDCTHCDKKFTSKASLATHLRYYTADKPYQCKYCEKRFLGYGNLKIHEDYHTGTKPYMCVICGKSFHRQCTMKEHMKIHTDEKQYKCSYCAKAFYQKYDMITHERRHTGERFECLLCEGQFMHAHQLNSHLKTVHNCDVECRRRGVKKFFDESSPPPEPKNVVVKEA